MEQEDPIGKISEGKKIVQNLLVNWKLIPCPNIMFKHTCGCGLCAPKSKYEKNYRDVINNHITRPEILA